MLTFDLSSYEHVVLDFDDRGILTAAITNPEKRNAVNAGVAADLDRLWREADANPDVRVIVLTGAGNAFCSGLDLSLLSSGTNQAERASRRGKGGAKGIPNRVFDIVDCETRHLMCRPTGGRRAAPPCAWPGSHSSPES